MIHKTKWKRNWVECLNSCRVKTSTSELNRGVSSQCDAKRAEAEVCDMHTWLGFLVKIPPFRGDLPLCFCLVLTWHNTSLMFRPSQTNMATMHSSSCQKFKCRKIREVMNKLKKSYRVSVFVYTRQDINLVLDIWNISSLVAIFMDTVTLPLQMAFSNVVFPYAMLNLSVCTLERFLPPPRLPETPPTSWLDGYFVHSI